MGAFSDQELQYLKEQQLGRLATLGPDGGPQSRPVGFGYNPELDTIDIGGMTMATSRKFRNVEADGRVSFVVDDVESVDPWLPRGVEVRGVAEALHDASSGGQHADLIRIHPTRVLSWGIDTPHFDPPNSRPIRRD